MWQGRTFEWVMIWRQCRNIFSSYVSCCGLICMSFISIIESLELIREWCTNEDNTRPLLLEAFPIIWQLMQSLVLLQIFYKPGALFMKSWSWWEIPENSRPQSWSLQLRKGDQRLVRYFHIRRRQPYGAMAVISTYWSYCTNLVSVVTLTGFYVPTHFWL